MTLDQVDQYRRIVIFGGLGAAACGNANKLRAQETEFIPPSAETAAFLESPASVALLINQFGLAYSLAVNLALHFYDQSAPGSAGEIALTASQGSGVSDLFQYLYLLKDEESVRADAIQQLEIAADPISEIGPAHVRIVDSFVSSLSEYGVAPESPLIEPAVESLTHVARLAAPKLGSSATGFWCDYFPFSTIFC